MYGMINIAIEDLIISEYGEDSWQKIKQDAGIDTEGFVSMHSYPDTLTYSIVGEASKQLNIEATTLLEKIGEYWIIHTAKVGYGDLLDAAGGDIVEFLKSLNAMHSRLANIMPQMQIPTFELSDITPKSMTIHYRSHRKGLEYMVVGLLKGLGKRFELECSIEMTDAISVEGTYQMYKLKW
jgi:Haem-NO-binding